MYENIPAKTFIENSANIFSPTKHITFIAKNHDGLKNLFKIISFANTNYIQRNARIPRKLVNEYRDGILVGSSCLNGEIFDIAKTRCESDLIEAMKFYDYIEIQPLENYMHLIKSHDINNIDHLKDNPDVYILKQDEVNITKDVIKDLLNKLSTTSQFNNKKVYIIDKTEYLSDTVFNAILKTLEEPKEGIYAILISNNIDAVKPTIVSRCQKIFLTSSTDKLELSDETEEIANNLIDSIEETKKDL